jgi:hypothetical protein
MLLSCSGCFHHKIAIEDGFRLSENGDAPMLVPTNGPTSEAGNFQTSKLVLPGGFAGANDQVSHQCAIKSEIFAFSSVPPHDSRHWIVRSPSISGWNKLAGETDIYSQWKIFTRELTRMNENGCFPPGLTALEIRAAIAQKIPLPADEVSLFFYSEQGIGFIDLAPGMEVRLQRFVPAESSIGAQSKGASQEGAADYWAASYEVIPRHGGGVRLKLSRMGQKRSHGVSGPEEREFFSLSQRFAQTPELRLLLEGVYGKREVSHGILIGAHNQRQLEALTDLIHQTDPVKCINSLGTVCIEYPLGAAPSLFYTVWVNGHRTACLPGTSLALLIPSPGQPQQTVSLESVRVFRRLNLDRYAEIDFPRTMSGAEQVRLLPGDRIEWRH